MVTVTAVTIRPQEYCYEFFSFVINYMSIVYGNCRLLFAEKRLHGYSCNRNQYYVKHIFFLIFFGRFKIIAYFCSVVWPRLCDRHIENEALCFDLVRET